MILTVEDFVKMFERDNNSTVNRQEGDEQLILFYNVMDCRYLDTLRSLRNKFKERYSCSQEQCPIIRERMEQHMIQRHSPARPARTAPKFAKVTRGIIGTGLSGLNSSTHTLLTPLGTYRDNPNIDYFSDKGVSYSGASARVLDTNIEDTLKRELKDDLVNIFEGLPLNPEIKETMLATLADDLSKIIVKDDLNTDGKIKAEIDKVVNKLLGNYPASELDNYRLVGDVRARLFDIVKDKQQDIMHKNDKNSDGVSAYSDVSNMYDENVPNKLTDFIKKLFENYPRHTGTTLSKEAKDDLLNRLIDDINQIANNKTITDANKKAEIEKILDDLHSKYSEPTVSQGKENYKNEIRDKLFDLIEDKPKDLADLVKNIFESYPIHTGTKLSKEAKEDLLNNLIVDLNHIARDETMTNSDKKAEIEKILDDLHSKYPEPMDSKEKEKLKNEIRNKLFDLVKFKPKDLTDPIKKLFDNYPIHTGTKLNKEAKENLVNTLIDDINQIAKNITMTNAEKKAEIKNILDDFHTKYPEPLNGEIKQKHKNEIRDKLFDLIKGKPRGSKKKWEVPTKEAFDLSPSGTGGRTGGTNDKKVGSKNSRFETAGGRSFVGGKSNRSFGGSNNNKMIGVSTGSGGGMNSKKIGNKTTNRLYGGGSDDNASWVGSSGARGVNSGANKSGTIGNGIGPNDGVFGGYSGSINNRSLAINDRNENPILNNNLSQEVTKLFENHPIFNQSPQSKGTKENILRHLVEDVNKIAANNNLSDDNVANEVDELVQRLHVRYPAHKSIQAQYKNEIRDKLYDMISNARFNNNRHKNGRKDINNDAGPSKKRPYSPQYDFKQSLNKMLEDIAIYPQTKDAHRDSVINNFFDDISWIADSIKPGNDNELNREIERALDRLHLWYPGAKRDQNEYRNDIRDRIFNLIKEYNKSKPIRLPKDDINESIISNDSDDSNSNNTRQDTRTIKYWVNQLKHEKFMQGVDANELIKKLIDRIVPILKSNNCCGKITILKGAVLEIMSEIPATANCNNKLQRMVNDLVNNLYCRHKNDCCSSAGARRQTLFVDTIKNMWISNKLKKLNEFLDDNNIARNHEIRNQIAYLIMAIDEEPGETLIESDLENDVNTILEDKTINVSASEVINTYKNIIKGSNNDGDRDNGDGTYLNCLFTKDVSVYTSKTSFCATSTPKKTASKEVQKLNNEEIKYINDLSNFIRAWMETLPVQFNDPEEKGFKDAMIAELAGEIMDIAKTAQITPHTKEQLNTYHKHLVSKWINKLNVCELESVAPQVEDFMKRLEDIPVPVLTTPHQGTRQAMDNIKVREEQGWDKDFLPKGIDVLEDEISIWVNEQPSDMFNFSKESRNNKIHTLAETIKNKLENKSSESKINHDIEQWLNDNVRMDKCADINEVKDALINRVIKLPGDATIAANYEEKQRERAAQIELIEKQKKEPKQARIDEDTMDIERTMKDFIVKFVDHHYDVDNPLAIRTFNYLLKRELQRINPKSSCQGTCSYQEALSPQKLYEELELVKTISDWLKNLPIDEDYHKVGNRERIDLVLDLTRSIKAIEDERERCPCAMDHDLYLATTIHSYFCNIPIIKEYAIPRYHGTMLQQILNRVYAWRELIAKKRMENSLDDSGIHEENIGDFIEEFIRHHGTEIADDEVKMEAWSIRLLREIKEIIQNAPDPKIVTKSQVYNKLASVPIPGDDTVERFDRELVYIEEITEWMKNLPLLHLDVEDEKERGEEEENRRIMICDLAETMAEKENLADDAEFKEYLTKWIQDLPLDQTREINIPFLIDQLIHRIERTMKDNNVVVPIVSTATDSQTVVSKSSSKSKNRLKSPSKQAPKNPGTLATDAIEKWSKSLPIPIDEAAQGAIERKLYQKIGEFNSDPNAFHDDLLYQTLLTVEVDEVLEKLPGGNELPKTMEQQNKELVKSLVDARKIAKEKGAGDDYKHRLERSIDASIPSPVTPKQVFDPAFEIYKSRLADMFILENFDHSNDDVKMKYERRIKDEIDKYFNSAAKRNATRLTNHEIYNELYSALFKVPIPNENSVKEEVEQIKTRCVIDAWVETLPIIHNDNFYEQLELDKKVETLAKRIYEIEKLPKSDEKLTKKISQWLTNVPLQPGEEDNIQKYTDTLKKELKASKRQRKYSVDKGAKGKKGKGKSKQKKTKHDGTQIPGSDINLHSSTNPQLRKAADLIVDIVEQWSNTIPLSSHDNMDVETVRNDVVRKVLIKISDLNSNPDIFNNSFIYKDILDEELDKILSETPKCCDLEPNKIAQIKSTLIEAVIAVKPLIKEERVRFNYVHDLNNTVDRMLERPDNLPDDKISKYDTLKEDIVENFVQIHYDKDDVEGKQEYKAKVYDDVVTFFNDIAGEKDHNPQMRMNQLLTELAKVPVPNNEVLKEEVETVRMKNEINDFFDVNNVKQPKDKSISIDALKTSLARKLVNIEKGGHNKENDDKMKNEITKTLKKLNKELKPRTIEGFVNKLQANESTRKRKATKNDTVCEKSCKMLKFKEKEAKKAKKLEPCDNATCTNNVFKNTTTDNSWDNTCSDMAMKPCDNSTCSNKILKDTTTANTCDFTNPDNLETKLIGTICNNKTCSRYNKNLQTNPLDSESTQTACNDCENVDIETESSETYDENDDAYLLAEGPEEEICPCEKKMRDMWRYYMEAARWRCEGPEDPFCRDPTARKEMAPMGPIMAPLRRY